MKLNEAKEIIKKFKKNKNFEKNKNDKIYEEKWASNKNKVNDERKFCLVVSVLKYDNKPNFGIVSLSQKEMKKGYFASFEEANNQLYQYAELLQVM